MAIYALLIGINDYAGNVPALGGCHNDVERFANVLKSRFKVAETDIKCLLSRNATKANIIAAFQSHLAQAGEGDSVVVYYSGHGSQERAPDVFWDIEPDRQNETLVCHDSRVGAGDLADKELRFLIAQLAERKPHIVVIFDCCHSGGGTRGAESVSAQAVRLTKPAIKSRALPDYVFFEQAQQAGWVKDMRQLPEGAHIFLSGCQDSELSKELIIEGKQHGAFTHFLCKTLESTSSSLSYRNLVTRINQQVQGLVQKQHPQVEGVKEADVNRLFLGEEIQAVKLVVVAINDQWVVNAGAIQGMSVGDQLALYRDNEEDVAIGAVIESVKSERSVLDIAANVLDKTMPYQASIVHQKKPKLAICIEGDAQGVTTARHVLENIDGVGHPSRLLQENATEASYRLFANEQRYTVSLRIDERPLLMPVEGGYNEGSAKKALRQLEHMAKWQHRLDLMNVGSRLAEDAVQLVVHYQGKEIIDENIELGYTWQQGQWVVPEYGLELRLNPALEHPKPLYCALLFFTASDSSIQLVTGNGMWLRAEKTVDMDNGAANKLHARPSIKLFDGDTIEGFVDDVLYAQGISEVTDSLKLIVSEVEFDASLLEQEGLALYDKTLDPLVQQRPVTRGVALTTLLDEAVQYTNTRGMRVKQKTKLADWNTRSLSITTIRPLAHVTVSDRKTASLGFGVTVEPHALTAVISLESPTEASRSLDAIGKGDMLTPMALQDDQITPAFSLSPTASVASATRGVDANLSVIKLDGIADAELVTAKNPLVINVETPLAESEQVLPFAFDGEFYYPLGYALAKDNKTRVLIETLPERTLSQQGSSVTRGLGGSLKIYFQKVIYGAFELEKDTVRLAIPEFDSDNQQRVIGFNENKEQIKAEVLAAENIVIFIHGIIGETRSMAGVLHFPMAEGQLIAEQYDMALCFDYENLSTPIQETAQAFKAKLEAVGLAEGHGKQVHIVAHSMGGLVSRWMIEREGGNKLVSKLVMLGTPNNGSPWAGIKNKSFSMVNQWTYGVLTLILNGLTAIPAAGNAVAGMMKLISAVDDTLDQMGEDSEFVQALYQSPDPEIPYYLIAGTTQALVVSTDEDDGRVKQLFKIALQRSKLAAYEFLSDSLFSKQNDVAVNAMSMKYIDTGRKPALQVSDVVSDHMSYFVVAESVEALSKALRA